MTGLYINIISILKIKTSQTTLRCPGLWNIPGAGHRLFIGNEVQMTHISNFLVANKLWVLLSIGVVFNFFWVIQFNKKLRINAIVTVVLTIIHMISGVLFTKLLAFIEGSPGGMSLFGGLFLVPVLCCVVALIFNRNLYDACDVFTIPTIVAMFFGRLNCLFSGCCLGTIIPGTENVRWPTRELELVLYVILYMVLRNKVNKTKYRGRIYPIYMITYGIFRFIVEWFRESGIIIGGIHIAHIWALVAVLIGLVVCYILYRHDNMSIKNSKAVKNRR